MFFKAHCFVIGQQQQQQQQPQQTPFNSVMQMSQRAMDIAGGVASSGVTAFKTMADSAQAMIPGSAGKCLPRLLFMM